MKKNIFKNCLLGILASVVLFATSLGFASDDLEAVVYLTYQESRMSAVATDMHFNLGWIPDDKEAMKEASIEAVEDLKQIGNDIKALEVSLDLEELKQKELQLCEALEDFYFDIDIESEEERSQQAELISSIVKENDQLFTDAAMHLLKINDDFQESSLPDQAQILLTNQIDKEQLDQSIYFMCERNFKAAYEILTALKDAYAGTQLEDCLKVFISDCLLFDESDAVQSTEDYEYGFRLLEEVVNSGRYSPALSMAFYRWRTNLQRRDYGMSNWSKIPNDMYNQKRWELVEVVVDELKKYPENQFMRFQLVDLLATDNIQRGGQFGNDNLVHWARLYTDICEE